MDKEFILCEDYVKLAIKVDDKIIATITENEVIVADNVEVVLTPKYD